MSSIVPPPPVLQQQQQPPPRQERSLSTLWQRYRHVFPRVTMGIIPIPDIAVVSDSADGPQQRERARRRRRPHHSRSPQQHARRRALATPTTTATATTTPDNTDNFILLLVRIRDCPAFSLWNGIVSCRRTTDLGATRPGRYRFNCHAIRRYRRIALGRTSTEPRRTEHAHRPSAGALLDGVHRRNCRHGVRDPRTHAPAVTTHPGAHTTTNTASTHSQQTANK